MFQFHIQNGGLDRVEARIDTNHIVIIAGEHTMVDDTPDFLIQRIVIGEQSTTVTVAPQVLGGEERGASNGAQCTALLQRIVVNHHFRANGLAIVLNDRHTMFIGNFEDFLHVAALPKQMNGHNSFGFGRDSRFQLSHIHVESVFLHIHENGCQPQKTNYLNGSDKGEWGGDDLVAGFQVQRHHGHQEGVGAVAAGNHMLHMQVFFQMLLEALYLGTVDIS